jgi:lipoprotein-releasing system permease protein
VSAVPLVEGQALASSPSQASGVLVRGIRQADLPKVTGIFNNVRLGPFNNFQQSHGVAIGTRLATQLGLTLGENITIVTPRGSVTPLGVTPRVKAYPIVAIFEIGMAEYDSTFVIMPFADAQAYFNLDDQASAIEVYLQNADAVATLRPAIETAIQRQALITDWRERNVTFFSALEVERNVMFLILTLIVLVAALNIISGMTMLVKDKGHDIAILRTMGATRGSILRVFFITGASIGTLGTLAGFILGVVVNLNVEAIRQFLSRVTQTELFSPELYFLSQLPAQMDARETITVIVMALGLSFLATLYPAWRAARLDPVEALRYE